MKLEIYKLLIVLRIVFPVLKICCQGVRLHGQKLTTRTPEENERRCQLLAVDPEFDMDMVLEETWTIYYTWNMRKVSRCVNFTFHAATPKTVVRIYNDMNEYLAEQPTWNAATMLMVLGPARRELLFFYDQGLAGRFAAVSNTMKDYTLIPMRYSVPLLKIQAKVVNDGMFLVLMDCFAGVGYLSARSDQAAIHDQIETVASKFEYIFGPGKPACDQDPE